MMMTMFKPFALVAACALGLASMVNPVAAHYPICNCVDGTLDPVVRRLDSLLFPGTFICFSNHQQDEED
jgi:hypothetical protein